ncbi:GNAT family N-acetyltransferase [Halobacillus salinarum]|uniref:GNAT family N-acetyltransferase n=1 Tax=Halobacillus salinarum TaxID=2932257 RepID=A0ABY4ESL1_9BACI|nr:GNAT family N-acetyltransferase [Halobacillus salinarum]UOQ45131.1 GNAT family N-acetyltransferase [Halobacillus salinarum]
MPDQKEIFLREVQDRSDFLPLLLIGDESEEMVKEYMDTGDLYEIIFKGKVAGVCLFTYFDHHVVELKNIGILPEYRSRGLGKTVLHQACHLYKNKKMTEMIAGTANSSIENLAFYQKAGFQFAEIRKGFFLQYPEPIFENGIQAVDMILFKKGLKEE